MLEYGLRFLAGGIAVSAFAALGDTLRPKSFAGLFGAAPSIALATLLITLSQKGAPFVAMEGRSMIVGAFALGAYSWTVCVLLTSPNKRRFTARPFDCLEILNFLRSSNLQSRGRPIHSEIPAGPQVGSVHQ